MASVMPFPVSSGYYSEQSRLSAFLSGIKEASISENGDKIKPSTFAWCDKPTVRFSVFHLSKLAGGEQHFMLFADGKSTGDSRRGGARGCSRLVGTK